MLEITRVLLAGKKPFVQETPWLTSFVVGVRVRQGSTLSGSSYGPVPVLLQTRVLGNAHDV